MWQILFFDPSLGFFLEASRPLRPRRFFHQDTQQMVPTAIIQVPIFRPKKSKHLCFLSNIHHPSSQRQRNSNRGAKKRPPRRLRVAGCCSVTLRLASKASKVRWHTVMQSSCSCFTNIPRNFAPKRKDKNTKCWCRETLEKKQGFLDWEIRSAHFKQRPIRIISGR